MNSINQGIALVASSLLRWWAFSFLRLLPLGYYYLPRITSAFLIYLGTLAFAIRSPRHRKRKWGSSLISLLTGIPSLGSPIASKVGLFINLACVFLSLDFVFRTHWLHPDHNLSYSRTGYSTSNEVKLFLRSPNSSPLNVTYQSEGHAPMTVSFEGLSANTDFTHTFTLDALLPKSHYSYTTTLGHSGSFTTARQHEDLSQFSILSTSCLKPNWPYNPFRDSRSVDGFSHMDKYISKMKRKPEHVLFLGDWIYSDLPIKLGALTRSYYERLYRNVYASPDLSQNLKDLSWLHVFDDHEIINDWYQDMPEGKAMFDRAMTPYNEYHHGPNPSTTETYYTFTKGKVSFFILDARSFRSPPPHREGPNSTAGSNSPQSHTMLGSKQLDKVKQWIREKDGKLKVLVSGVPFTRNWSEGGDEMDSWAGYLDEREEILLEFWKVGGGVIISGDRHEHATTEFPPPSHLNLSSSSSVIEFSTSPLSFFYQPFQRDYIPHPPTDIPIHSHWKGSSKFGVMDFDTSDEKVWKVLFHLVVDGEDIWQYEWKWAAPAASV